MSSHIRFLLFYSVSLSAFQADRIFPVDISYLVSDFKYSQEHGLKICEVQHGALSALGGDLYIWGEEGSILPKIGDFFYSFSTKKWAAGFLYTPLKKILVARDWDIQKSMNTLSKDSVFLSCATSPPQDPFSIASYAGIVYAAFDMVRDFDSYCKAFSGILFVDAATLPFWRDKYKMNALFNLCDELKKYKADWRLYTKKYDPHLHLRIQQEMPSEFYVIKPRREVLGNGVIVVANRDLDDVLQMILEPSANLQKHPEKQYSYWWKNKEDTFLIETYYESDYLSFPHSLGEKKSDGAVSHYDGTMRLAFILQYDKGKMTYHNLGGFWKLPSKALEEEGTLNEKRITCCRPPFYAPIDPELFNEVNLHMEKAMLLLYELMLNRQVE